MEIIYLKICELINKLTSELPGAIITSLVTSFAAWVCTLLVLSGQKVKIHKKIVHDINVSKDGEKWVYKFKIINGSMLANLYDFDIELLGIRIIMNTVDFSCTEHVELIAKREDDHRTGLKYNKLLVLKKYKTFPGIVLRRIIAKTRKRKYTIDFVYRIITSVDLNEQIKKYDKIRLTVKFKDTLFNRTHIVDRDFISKDTEIVTGMFSNDGSIRRVLPHPKSVIDISTDTK
jgi:hypothetical protein